MVIDHPEDGQTSFKGLSNTIPRKVIHHPQEGHPPSPGWSPNIKSSGCTPSQGWSCTNSRMVNHPWDGYKFSQDGRPPFAGWLTRFGVWLKHSKACFLRNCSMFRTSNNGGTTPTRPRPSFILILILMLPGWASALVATMLVFPVPAPQEKQERRKHKIQLTSNFENPKWSQLGS